jgi:hypothetical protein
MRPMFSTAGDRRDKERSPVDLWKTSRLGSVAFYNGGDLYGVT